MSEENSIDQSQAQEEGWVVIDSSAGWSEIQKDDSAPVFESDEHADNFVRAKADEGSLYHRKVLQEITNRNLTRYDPRSIHDGGGMIYMLLRTWADESVVSKKTVRVRVDFDPTVGPWDLASLGFEVRSDQDLVALTESSAVPDLTRGLDSFRRVVCDVERLESGLPTYCTCGGCKYRFSVLMLENSKVILYRGNRWDVPRCPACGALGNEQIGPALLEEEPEMGDLYVRNVNLSLLERQRKSFNRVMWHLHRWDVARWQERMPGVSREDFENLQGLEQLMDGWSDERYHRVEVT